MKHTPGVSPQYKTYLQILMPQFALFHELSVPILAMNVPASPVHVLLYLILDPGVEALGVREDLHDESGQPQRTVVVAFAESAERPVFALVAAKV